MCVQGVVFDFALTCKTGQKKKKEKISLMIQLILKENVCNDFICFCGSHVEYFCYLMSLFHPKYWFAFSVKVMNNKNNSVTIKCDKLIQYII